MDSWNRWEELLRGIDAFDMQINLNSKDAVFLRFIFSIPTDIGFLRLHRSRWSLCTPCMYVLFLYCQSSQPCSYRYPRAHSSWKAHTVRLLLELLTQSLTFLLSLFPPLRRTAPPKIGTEKILPRFEKAFLVRNVDCAISQRERLE